MLDFLRWVINAYMFVVLIYAIVSWVPNLRGSQFEAWLKTLVEPALKPVRQLLQPLQGGVGIDFSPAALMLGLYIIQRLL